MKYTIITTFHPAGLKLYGQTMIDSFDQYWPDNVDLVVYAENCQPKVNSSRVQIRDLHDSCPDLVAFKNRHRDNPIANGLVMKETGIPYKDNNFKWDAVRFSNKVYCVAHACKTLTNSDWVIWLDADTKTFRPVPNEFLPSICNEKSMACYLGRRAKYHSECGWVAYNRNHRDLSEFMAYWKELYDRDTLFDLREYHDSFLFDEVRKKFQAEKGTRFHNLTPETEGKGPGHPFIASALGSYMDHLKGAERKTIGKSARRGDDESSRFHQDVDYWR